MTLQPTAKAELFLTGGYGVNSRRRGRPVGHKLPAHWKKTVYANMPHDKRVCYGKASVDSPDHPTKRRMKCQHCGKVGGLGAMMRWHGDNCRLRT